LMGGLPARHIWFRRVTACKFKICQHSYIKGVTPLAI
jgi:hypothetical protein